MLATLTFALYASIRLFRQGDQRAALALASGLTVLLAVSLADFLRAQSGSGVAAGSTVFAATGSATADGNALIGRNVDWIDFDGRLKPTAIRFHPDNGDFDYVSVGWPLLQIPVVGLNQEGLAFSLNYFVTDHFHFYIIRQVVNT